MWGLQAVVVSPETQKTIQNLSRFSTNKSHVWHASRLPVDSSFLLSPPHSFPLALAIVLLVTHSERPPICLGFICSYSLIHCSKENPSIEIPVANI